MHAEESLEVELDPLGTYPLRMDFSAIFRS